MFRLNISYDRYLDIKNILQEVFNPLNSFLDEKDYQSVLEDCHLSSGSPWAIPITLEINESDLDKIKQEEVLELAFNQTVVALFQVSGFFKVNFQKDIPLVYGTIDSKHPGVAKELARSPYRLSGQLIKNDYIFEASSIFDLEPYKVKEKIRNLGWKKIVGFQTRNPAHRAHEYLQRVALEIADGLLIQPLTGWKKSGDFTAEAVIKGYEVLIKNFYSEKKVILATLQTDMKYAGPREAVHHALIRKNFGCTHFIVGRDHAGVGNYYQKYESQEFAKNFKNLGIEIIPLSGPFYCNKCHSISSESSCLHRGDDIVEVSATLIRKILSQGDRPNPNIIRSEVVQELVKLKDHNQLFY